jgi:hypothetical protein
LLTDAAASVPVSIAMSIAVFDDALQQSLEPGTPTAAARLATVRPPPTPGSVTVFLMPILPHLTDSTRCSTTPSRASAQRRRARRLRCAASAPGREGVVLGVALADEAGTRPAYRGLYPGHPPTRPTATGSSSPRVCARCCGHRLAGGAEEDVEAAAAPGPRQDDGRAAGDRLF